MKRAKPFPFKKVMYSLNPYEHYMPKHHKLESAKEYASLSVQGVTESKAVGAET